MLRATTLLAALSCASARTYTGTSSGLRYYVGKFAYGPAGGTVTASLADATTEVILLDDTVFDSSADAVSQCSQASAITATDGTTAAVPARSRPYFYFASIGARILGAKPACSTPSSTAFTVTLKQANGDQLSYDEVGLPAVYAVFFVVAAVQLGAHVWKHYTREEQFAPLIVKLLTLMLIFHTISDFSHMVEWALVANTGKGSTFLAVTAALLRLVGQSTLWVLAALAAVGHGISSSESNWRAHINCSYTSLRGIVLLAALILTYLIIAIVYAANSNAAPTRATAGGGAAAGIILLGLTIGFIVWFFVTMRATKAAEISLTKKAMLDRLTYVLAAAMVVLPLVELISARRNFRDAGATHLARVLHSPPPIPPFAGVATPSYESLRVVVGMDMFFLSAINAAFIWILWPERAADAFREITIGDDSSLESAYAALDTDKMVAAETSYY